MGAPAPTALQCAGRGRGAGEGCKVRPARPWGAPSGRGRGRGPRRGGQPGAEGQHPALGRAWRLRRALSGFGGAGGGNGGNCSLPARVLGRPWLARPRGPRPSGRAPGGAGAGESGPAGAPVCETCVRAPPRPGALCGRGWGGGGGAAGGRRGPGPGGSRRGRGGAAGGSGQSAALVRGLLDPPSGLGASFAAPAGSGGVRGGGRPSRGRGRPRGSGCGGVEGPPTPPRPAA